jgi:tetratricopeptide (TPR) repeat protein
VRFLIFLILFLTAEGTLAQAQKSAGADSAVQTLHRPEKALFFLGKLYFHEKSFVEAATLFSDGATANPFHFEGHLWLIQSDRQRGDRLAALRHLSKFLEVFPAQPQAHAVAAEEYESTGELERAEGHYRRAIDLARNQAQTRFEDAEAFR